MRRNRSYLSLKTIRFPGGVLAGVVVLLLLAPAFGGDFAFEYLGVAAVAAGLFTWPPYLAALVLMKLVGRSGLLASTVAGGAVACAAVGLAVLAFGVEKVGASSDVWFMALVSGMVAGLTHRSLTVLAERTSRLAL